MNEELGETFSDIDQSKEASIFINYLDSVNTFNTIQAYKSKAHEYLKLQDHHHVLEVGCGSGSDAVDLAKYVPKGKMVAIDHSQSMIETCKQRYQSTSLPIEFQVNSAKQLEFEDHTFDACRTDRVLLHIEKPFEVVQEMVRVLKPGGRIVICEPEWDTLVIDSEQTDLIRKLVHSLSDSAKCGTIGRKLFRFYKHLNLEEIIVHPFTFPITSYEALNQTLFLEDFLQRCTDEKVFSASEAKGLIDEFKEKQHNHTFFCSHSLFIVSGTKA